MRDKLALAFLRKALEKAPPGEVEDTTIIEKKLAECWEYLEGHGAGMMTSLKLRGRMEDVTWEPPLLKFTIERHGAANLGSGYGELQSWEVDLDKEMATLVDDQRKRWLGGPRNSPLNVDPLATELADLIQSGKPGPWLKWKSGNEVRILIGKVIPDNCPRQTLTGRRRRLKKALQELLGDGWELSRTNTVLKRSARAA